MLRALHRDFGYIAVGLTFIYALSGLAVNHIADWDPNFENYERDVVLTTARIELDGEVMLDDNRLSESMGLGGLS